MEKVIIETNEVEFIFADRNLVHKIPYFCQMIQGDRIHGCEHIKPDLPLYEICFALAMVRLDYHPPVCVEDDESPYGLSVFDSDETMFDLLGIDPPPEIDMGDARRQTFDDMYDSYMSRVYVKCVHTIDGHDVLYDRKCLELCPYLNRLNQLSELCGTTIIPLPFKLRETYLFLSMIRMGYYPHPGQGVRYQLMNNSTYADFCRVLEIPQTKQMKYNDSRLDEFNCICHEMEILTDVPDSDDE